MMGNCQVRFLGELRRSNPPFLPDSSDTAAALVVARRGIRTSSFKRFSDRLPRKYIKLIPSNQAYLGGTRKHSWSHWNELRRELGGVRRHNYFTSGLLRSRGQPI